MLTESCLRPSAGPESQSPRPLLLITMGICSQAWFPALPRTGRILKACRMWLSSSWRPSHFLSSDCTKMLSEHEIPRSQPPCPEKMPKGIQTGPRGGLWRSQTGSVQRHQVHSSPACTQQWVRTKVPQRTNGAGSLGILGSSTSSAFSAPDLGQVPEAALSEVSLSVKQGYLHLPHRALNAIQEGNINPA